MEGPKRRPRTELRIPGASPCRRCLIPVTPQVLNDVDRYNQPLEEGEKELHRALECLNLIPGRGESNGMVPPAWTSIMVTGQMPSLLSLDNKVWRSLI
jgi:hypothetical protein